MIKEIQKPYRDEICLNGYWQFMPEATPENILNESLVPKSIPSRDNWEETQIKVPSPWNVNSFTDGKGGDFRTYPSYPDKWNEVKCGWLKKTINVPSEWHQHRILLHFEAVAGYARIFVNGFHAGDHFDIFLPFNLDITEYVKAGQDACITVWVGKTTLFDRPGKFGSREHIAGSFWGSHIVGIWQDVYLQKVPEVYIEDIFVKPLLDQDQLALEVTVRNSSSITSKTTLNGEVYSWNNQCEDTVLDNPEVRWSLGQQLLVINAMDIQIEPYGTKRVDMAVKVNGKLPLWSPHTPFLQALILNLTGSGLQQDRHYVRFGWRTFEIRGKKLLLNGNPIQIKADSWHFMGVPQMSRRYAYAWYHMLKEANGNGVRLHAQVYPRFYLEMADEMGICVLDESSIWFSDHQTKIDSNVYWEACYPHIKGMVLRDRNHPSVFGWSVCNETMAVTNIVLRAPRYLRRKNVEEINKWIEIVRLTDSTRNWVSGDGEFALFTKLPTRILHYVPRFLYWLVSLGKRPWGVGETGKGYYGTPKQVARFNGDRSYESQLGRMEGLAKEAFNDIKSQRKNNAAYSSIFNIVWYGLKPLSLGLSDTERQVKLDDGIIFKGYIEAKPGYQPERLGPYSTTLNPGYDENLPLYDPWPLFEAIKSAFSDDFKKKRNNWQGKTNNTVKIKRSTKKKSIVWISSEEESITKTHFQSIGLSFNPLDTQLKQLIIIDGRNPIESQDLTSDLLTAMKNGSTVLFWKTELASCPLIERLTGESATVHEREASSYVIRHEHPILRNERNRSYYFSELSEKPVSIHTLGGNWLVDSTTLLEACSTDWRKWNFQPEPTKTANVYRSELEEKKPGNVIVQKSFGEGELIVSTLDLFSLMGVGGRKVRKM
ncbi:MAG: glycoside hydrolase family 2 protein, partial [Promethearchaeota archaeon]